MWDSEDEEYVVTMKPITEENLWMKDNPGQQHGLLTGSFHPLFEARHVWEQGAYVADT